MDVIVVVDVDVEVTTDDERASLESDLLKNGREFVENNELIGSRTNKTRKIVNCIADAEQVRRQAGRRGGGGQAYPISLPPNCS